MAEEHKWQEPEGHRLCANNCGFFGSPTTLDLCSKCYKDRCLKEERATTAKLAVEKSLTQSPSASSSSSSSSSELLVSFTPDRPISPENPATFVKISAPAAAVSTQANRCAACRKRVGLTGFKCRCGPTYCGAHRYPEEHGCTFDFKALGKEAIAKANPVVVAEKLEKI